jgi:hypothetical protein
MPIKSFKGMLADGGQDRIRLSTRTGKTGYRIVKFQIMQPPDTGSDRYSCVQIWNQEQDAPSTTAVTVDFTDLQLLGTAVATYDNTQPQLTQATIIFDNTVFNQDIYITHTELTGGGACNYYLELEAVPLSDMSAEFTTLKDLRANTATVPA